MRESDVKGTFWHWGAWMYRYRWWVLIVWIILISGLAYNAQQTLSLFKDNGFTPVHSESDQGLTQIREQLGLTSTILEIVYESKQRHDLTTPEETAKLLESLADLRQQPYVENVYVNPAKRLEGQQHVQSISVQLNLDTNQALELYPEMRKRIPEVEGVNVHVSGGTAVYYDMNVASKRDIARSEMIGLPIALVVLLLVFGTLFGALLPIIVGAASVTTTLGLLYFIGQYNTQLSSFLPNLVTMLGLAVGIDYALFMVSRFREELKQHQDVRDAVAMTCQKAGKSIFFSGIAVLIGLVAMYFIKLSIFESLSLGGVMVVSVSVLVANTLLLALLGLFGHKINKFRVIPASWRRSKTNGKSPFWHSVAHGVMKRPVLIAIAISTLLIALMLPVGSIKMGVPEAEVLPPSYSSRYGSDLLKTTYDVREMHPIQIVVTAPDNDKYWDRSTIQAMMSYGQQIKKVPNVLSVTSYVNGVPGDSAELKAGVLQTSQVREQLEKQQIVKNGTMLMRIVSQTDSEDAATDQLVRDLRALDPGPLSVKVTGGPAYKLDIVERINEQLPIVVGFILIVTYVVLLIAFRSVLLPLKAVIMNILSLGASLGIVVLVFQDGFLADLFQVSSTGLVFAMLPVIIFCVVFGISMDYEVFLISRIIEQYEMTGDNERSTAEGLIKTGSIITSAAFILIVVVGAFIFTDNEIMKAVGLGLATAVLIDATLIRIFLVPALMKLMGKANWWAPKWLKPTGIKVKE